MANATVDPGGGTGTGGERLLGVDVLAAALASDIDRMTKRFQGSVLATVTSVEFVGTGFCLATIGYSTVRVVCSSGDGLSVGDVIRVRRLTPDLNSDWEYVGGSSGGSGAVEYGLCFGDPANNTVGSVYMKWGGTISDVVTSGTGTVALTVGGVSVGEGSAVTAGTWLVATISGGSGDYFSVAVVVS